MRIVKYAGYTIEDYGQAAKVTRQPLLSGSLDRNVFHDIEAAKTEILRRQANRRSATLTTMFALCIGVAGSAAVYSAWL